MPPNNSRLSSGLPLARVLVVDDDPDVREVLAAALEDEGYAVATAADGAAALRHLAAADEAGQLAPHAVLLAMKMPTLDGAGFLAAYRQRPGPRAPILVLTASRHLAAPGLGADSGDVADVVLKPFDLPDLLARLAELVRRSPTR